MRHAPCSTFCCALVLSLVSAGSASAQLIRQVATPSNDITYDPFTNTIFASVPSSAGADGNSVRALNPVTAALGPAVFVGSEPGKLALSDNGQYLYVALNGAAAVRRYDVASATAGLQFPVGSGGLGTFYAEDMVVLRGQPNSVAISRRNQGFSPRHEGVAIYDNGVQRPTATPGHTGSNVIEPGGDPATIYGYNNETTEFGFRTHAVGPGGITTSNTTGNLISGFGVDIEYAGGIVFSTTGRAIDPVNRTLLGTYAAGGPLEADPVTRRVFFLSSAGSTATIQAFNIDTFLNVGSITVNGVSGSVGSLIRWGGDGLAFRTSGNQIFLINSSLVPEPAALSALAMSALLLVRRRGR